MYGGKGRGKKKCSNHSAHLNTTITSHAQRTKGWPKPFKIDVFPMLSTQYLSPTPMKARKKTTRCTFALALEIDGRFLYNNVPGTCTRLEELFCYGV